MRLALASAGAGVARPRLGRTAISRSAAGA